MSHADRLTQAAADLEYVAHVLGQLRFAGFDQNPKGIRDLLSSATAKVRRTAAQLTLEDNKGTDHD